MSIAYNASHSRKHLLKEIHMSRVLALKSSILGDYSQSNKLVEDFIKNVDQDYANCS